MHLAIIKQSGYSNGCRDLDPCKGDSLAWASRMWWTTALDTYQCKAETVYCWKGSDISSPGISSGERSPEAEKYCFNCHCLSRDLNHSNHLSRCVHFGTHCGAFTKIMSRSRSPHPFHSVGDSPFMGLNLSDLRMYRLQSMTAKCVFMWTIQRAVLHLYCYPRNNV